MDFLGIAETGSPLFILTWIFEESDMWNPYEIFIGDKGSSKKLSVNKFLKFFKRMGNHLFNYVGDRGERALLKKGVPEAEIF